MKKKFAICLCAVILAVSSTACGTNTVETVSEAASVVEETSEATSDTVSDSEVSEVESSQANSEVEDSTDTTDSGGNMEQKVTCSHCNGTGEVKYYFGNGDDEYNLGPCPSCDGKGFNMVATIGSSDGGKKVICGSCSKYVDDLITKEDAAGEQRTWCAECWEEYDQILGR